MYTAVLRCLKRSFNLWFPSTCVYEMPQCNDDRSKRNPSVCSGSRRRDSSSPGHMPIAWVRSWQSSTPTTPRADVPSCAIAAVLVVAAGLVCCRPTIGQRGIQCGGTGGTGAMLKPDSHLVLWILRLMNFKASDKQQNAGSRERLWYDLDEVKQQTGRLLGTKVPVPQNY